MRRCVVLDDYQNVAREFADWSSVENDIELVVHNAPLGNDDQVIAALKDAEIVCLMRERTAFPRAVVEALPNLKLIVTTGLYNAAVDLEAALARGIVISGTRGLPHPTAELAFGLMLDLARNISREDAAMKRGVSWQTTIGTGLHDKTLGLVGLGRLGARVAKYARAFDMGVIAWSQNLTAERAQEGGATLVSKEELFARADFLSIHLVLSPRTRGIVGADDFARMKSTAYIVNTSRGPIVDTAALLDALNANRIAGAAIDVYDEEPLPADSPLRKAPNLVLTPHLGYVTRETYQIFYRDTVEDIRAWLDGNPIRLVTKNK